MLTVTDRAAAVIRSVCSDEDIAGLRIMVQTGGCSGLQYRMGLESEAMDGDEILACGDRKLFVDAGSVMWLMGATIDFVDGAEGAGFVFDNPNAAGKCSCPGTGGC